MRQLEQLGVLNRKSAEAFRERVWARIFQGFKEAVPAEEKLCEHFCGPGYCKVKGCEHHD